MLKLNFPTTGADFEVFGADFVSGWGHAGIFFSFSSSSTGVAPVHDMHGNAPPNAPIRTNIRLCRVVGGWGVEEEEEKEGEDEEEREEEGRERRRRGRRITGGRHWRGGDLT